MDLNGYALGDGNALISVIIVAFNRRNFLLSALNSVLNQTIDRKEYEIIVIKNYTDDEMDNYLIRNNVKLLYSTEKKYGKKVVQAIRMCKGEVISFLDDDDLFSENKLNHVKDIFVHNPNIFLYKNFRTLVSHSPIDNKTIKRFNWEKKYIISLGKVIYGDKLPRLYELRKYWLPFNNSSMTIRKSKLTDMHLELISNINIAFDICLFFLSLSIEDGVLVDDFGLTQYRIHGKNSTSSSNTDTVFKTIEDYRNIHLYFGKNVNNMVNKLFTSLYVIEKMRVANSFNDPTVLEGDEIGYSLKMIKNLGLNYDNLKIIAYAMLYAIKTAVRFTFR